MYCSFQIFLKDPLLTMTSPRCLYTFLKFSLNLCKVISSPHVLIFAHFLHEMRRSSFITWQFFHLKFLLRLFKDLLKVFMNFFISVSLSGVCIFTYLRSIFLHLFLKPDYSFIKQNFFLVSLCLLSTFSSNFLW